MENDRRWAVSSAFRVVLSLCVFFFFFKFVRAFESSCFLFCISFSLTRARACGCVAFAAFGSDA